MMLTVFTPTYNRAIFLGRLYESLLKQANRDFEWLIIDDGSTDETEQVVKKLATESPFPIVYHRKENGGKHSAHNVAVEMAQGEWFLCVDSDDTLEENAVGLLASTLGKNQGKDAGIVAYKRDKNGALLSSRFAFDLHQGGLYSYYRQGVSGEFAIVLLTSLLRKYPYPVIPSERFMGEGVLYDRLELEGYTVCPLDAVLEICEYQSDGLSSNSYKLLIQNPTGYQIYHAQRIDLAISFMERLRHCICFQAFKHMSKNRDYLYQGPHKWLVAVVRLPGIAAAYYYRLKGKQIA